MRKSVKTITKRILPGGLFHLIQMYRNSQYRTEHLREEELKRIMNIPRYTKSNTGIFGEKFTFTDSHSFYFMYNEIFKNQIYKFHITGETPYIIDVGANVGVSALYFKQLSRRSELLLFEPDPNIFRILKENIQNQKLQNIQINQKAVWKEDTILDFISEGADAGRIENGDQAINVETTRLSRFINRKVDFLKIDIEGAEVEVLQECSDVLYNVEKIFIEYHSFVDKAQELSVITSLLEENEFRYLITTPGLVSEQPFINVNSYLGMDMQLNIYAYKQ